MKKKKIKILNLISAGIFCGFIFALTVLNLFHTNGTFSRNENRPLAGFPEVSVQNVFFGDFDTEFENWFSDQFIGRDAWIERKAAVRRSAGAIENNGVYFGRGHRLIQQFLSYNREQADHNIQYLKEFAEENKVRLNILLVPGASTGEKKYLPLGAYNVDETELIDTVAQKLPEHNCIDIASLLGTSGDYYYHTDHHWNEAGAKIGYDAICRSVLKKESRAFTYETVSDSFRGTMYSRSGAFRTPADSIRKIIPASDLKPSVEFEDGTVMHSLFNEKRLDEKDQYTYYLDGNHSYVHIKTEAGTGRRALIIKDSFAHILVPYLAAEYDEIEMFDLRYFNGSVSEHIKDKEHMDIYVIYGVETFCTDKNLAVLW